MSHIHNLETQIVKLLMQEKMSPTAELAIAMFQLSVKILLVKEVDAQTIEKGLIQIVKHHAEAWKLIKPEAEKVVEKVDQMIKELIKIQGADKN